MAGRDCLPATPFDSAGRTHDPRRALTRTESSKTPHSCFATYVRQHTTNSEFAVRAQDMQAKHVCAQPKRPGCSASLRPCIRPRSRAHCCWQMPDLRYLPEAQSKAPTCDASGGGRPALQRRLKHPSARPPSAGSDAPDHPVPCRAPLCCLVPHLCAKQGERAAVESRASSRAHLWHCGLVQPSAPHGLRIMGLYWVF